MACTGLVSKLAPITLGSPYILLHPPRAGLVQLQV